MKIAAQIVSFIALTSLLLSATLFLLGSLEKEMVNEVVLYATIVWFVSAPYWMLKDEQSSEQPASE